MFQTPKWILGKDPSPAGQENWQLQELNPDPVNQQPGNYLHHFWLVQFNDMARLYFKSVWTQIHSFYNISIYNPDQ